MRLVPFSCLGRVVYVILLRYRRYSCFAGVLRANIRITLSPTELLIGIIIVIPITY